MLKTVEEKIVTFNIDDTDAHIIAVALGWLLKTWNKFVKDYNDEFPEEPLIPMHQILMLPALVRLASKFNTEVDKLESDEVDSK